MYWRTRYVWRRVRLRLARMVARGPASILVRGLLPLYLALGLAAGGYIWARENPERVGALWTTSRGVAMEWAGESAGFITSRLSGELDAESGVRLLESVLPTLSSHRSVVEPAEAWRTPMRAWVYIVTGFDFSEPRSFFEATVPGFREAERHVLDRIANNAPPERESNQESNGPGTVVAQRPDVSRSEGTRTDGREEPERQLPDQTEAEEGVGDEDREGENAQPELSEEVERPSETEATASRERGPDGVPAALLPVTARAWGDEPLVLIIHTHTSESYRTLQPDPQANSTNHVFNSSDTGITRVGEALATKLREQYNIGTIHTVRIHDWPQHVTAYRNARETVEEFLERYPSIQVVLDLHRQGIPNYTYAKTIGDTEAVAIEVIYTTAQSLPYASHPNWRSNQAFATRLGEVMEEVHPGLLRRVMRVDDSRYNQDLHPRMLLLEMGNYLDLEEHAITSAKLLADPLARALADMIDQGEASPAPPNSTRAATQVDGDMREDSGVVPPPPPRPVPHGRASS